GRGESEIQINKRYRPERSAHDEVGRERDRERDREWRRTLRRPGRMEQPEPPHPAGDPHDRECEVGDVAPRYRRDERRDTEQRRTETDTSLRTEPPADDRGKK